MARKPKTEILWPGEIRPQVRILIRAGVVARTGRQDRFIGAVEPGTLGAYVGPHPTVPDCHMIDVTTDGYVPLDRSQFERA